ncbi:hypothetical protein ACFL96_01055 [Thermoproteota archaeon]
MKNSNMSLKDMSAASCLQSGLVQLGDAPALVTILRLTRQKDRTTASL